MAQHVSQSKAFRNYPLPATQALTEQQAWELLRDARWGSTNTISCPWCGIIASHTVRRTRKQWCCKECGRVFGVMTETPFVDLKLSYKKLLLLIHLFVTAPKGLAANQVLSVMGVTLRTTYQNLGKIREAIFQTQDLRPLSGTVQIDGGHFCGKPRRPQYRNKMTSGIANNILRNRKAAIVPPDKRYSIERWNKKKLQNRRIVLVLRQVSPIRTHGAKRTIVAIIPAEEKKYVLPLIQRFVAKSAVIQTDSGKAYSGLYDWAAHETVNHSQAYCSPTGVNNNQAESFIARLRRAEYAVHHGMRHQYLAFYAAEMAWREDLRKLPIKEKFYDLLRRIFCCPPSKAWRGYAQGNRLGFEYIYD